RRPCGLRGDSPAHPARRTQILERRAAGALCERRGLGPGRRKMIAAPAAFLLAFSAAAAQAPVAGGLQLLDTPAQGPLVRGAAPPGTRSLMLDGRPVPVAPDGRFLIGFDRDAGPNALLVAVSGNGTARPAACR